MTDTVACRTPTPGRDGVTRIPAWKFDALSTAILTVLAQGPLPFKDLKDRVAPLLPEEVQARLGSLGWHLTTVKLEMEVQGQIRRLPGVTPQQNEAT